VFIQCLFGYNRISTEFALIKYNIKYEDIPGKIAGGNIAEPEILDF